MPTMILTGAAAIFAGLSVPTILMLAPKGGLAAGTAAGLVEVGSTTIERRIQTVVTVCGVISAVACLAVRILG